MCNTFFFKKRRKISQVRLRILFKNNLNKEETKRGSDTKKDQQFLHISFNSLIISTVCYTTIVTGTHTLTPNSDLPLLFRYIGSLHFFSSVINDGF